MGNDEGVLIREAIQGNINSFEKIVLKYEKIIYNIAYRMLNNKELSKDIVQEVFIKIYKNLKKYNFTSKFYTWIYRITINTCIDEIRRNNKCTTISLDRKIDYKDDELQCQIEDKKAIKPQEEILNKEIQDKVILCINKLAPNYRAIMILRFINQLEYNEISEILDCSLGTVKSRLSRAKEKFKNIYNNIMEQNEIHNRLTTKEGGEYNEK